MGQVPFLKVGSRTYGADHIHDGHFDSISHLKSQDKEILHSSPSYQFYCQDYENILKICNDKKVLPPISLEASNKILFKMKSQVNDFFSITPMHYINAGCEGLLHFNYLLNYVINDVNLASVEELNVVYALLVHKGHGKLKTLNRSYRTISTCPFLSKGLDLHIHDLYISVWDKLQAPTQYQGSGSSHELAALLLTEVIQHSKAQNLPLFLLFLDAMSAFDIVVIEYMVRFLYLSGVDGDALLFLNQRLTNRKTYLDWNQVLMGPISDEHGVEQGGVNSSDYYKLYNNQLLETLQKSGQGVQLARKLTISAIGQTDDIVICSNDIYMLYNLLTLALDYCRKFSIELSADKTKLLLYADKTRIVPLNPVIIDQKQIDFSDDAEHVGIVRATSGNIPNLMNRVHFI